jgi:hypothetical protein
MQLITCKANIKLKNAFSSYGFVLMALAFFPCFAKRVGYLNEGNVAAE